jgi:hypothetical protein
MRIYTGMVVVMMTVFLVQLRVMMGMAGFRFLEHRFNVFSAGGFEKMRPGFEFRGHVFGEKNIGSGLLDPDFKFGRDAGVVELQDMQFTEAQTAAVFQGLSVLLEHVQDLFPTCSMGSLDSDATYTIFMAGSAYFRGFVVEDHEVFLFGVCPSCIGVTK